MTLVRKAYVPKSKILSIQQEIRSSRESRYCHRLHAVLLVAQGLTCTQVADFFGDSVRVIQHWVHRFEKYGSPGLKEADRPGRPPKLNQNQLRLISNALKSPPKDFGLKAERWNGKILSKFIMQQFSVEIGIRQCQRLFHQLASE